jgi:hypothetical protein
MRRRIQSRRNLYQPPTKPCPVCGLGIIPKAMEAHIARHNELFWEELGQLWAERYEDDYGHLVNMKGVIAS